MNEERTLTKEQQQAFEEMLQEKTYCGDAFSAFRLFTNYLKGTNGFRKDPDKAFEYLKISSDLGYPHAINLLKLLYSGNDLYGLKIEPKSNFNVYVEDYLVSFKKTNRVP